MNRYAVPASLAVVALLFGCSGGPAPERPAADEATPVRTAPVEAARAASTVRAVGILAPHDEIRLSFKVGGVVESLAVDAGDTVRKGQVLAVLKRAEVDAAVTQAAEAAEKARRDLERGERLQADEVATREQVEDLRTAYNVARSSLQAAQFNARFARIEAPADGVVLQRLAKADELVQGGQPVLVLGATDQGWIVRASLADRDVVRTNPGDVARVRFDAFPGREFEGRVSRVATSADPQTGTFEVEIDLALTGERFARGLVAKVEIDLAQTVGDAARAAIPISAVVEARGTNATVFVLDAATGVARRREVVVGPIVGDRVLVLEGLAPGEQVVTDGAAWLADGRAIRVIASAG